MPVMTMGLHLFWELNVSQRVEGASSGFLTDLRTAGGAIEELSCKAKSIPAQHP